MSSSQGNLTHLLPNGADPNTGRNILLTYAVNHRCDYGRYSRFDIISSRPDGVPVLGRGAWKIRLASLRIEGSLSKLNRLIGHPMEVYAEGINIPLHTFTPTVSPSDCILQEGQDITQSVVMEDNEHGCSYNVILSQNINVSLEHYHVNATILIEYV